MRRLVLPTAVLLGTLVLAACGGTGSGTVGPTQGPASQPPAESEPPASAPTASEPAAGPCDGTTQTATVDATIADFAFGPEPVEASVGDVVGWTNEDSAPHSVVVGSDCRTGILQQGMTGALVFSEPGTYDYVCGVHPNMTGTVEIVE